MSSKVHGKNYMKVRPFSVHHPWRGSLLLCSSSPVRVVNSAELRWCTFKASVIIFYIKPVTMVLNDCFLSSILSLVKRSFERFSSNSYQTLLKSIEAYECCCHYNRNYENSFQDLSDTIVLLHIWVTVWLKVLQHRIVVSCNKNNARLGFHVIPCVK